MGDNSGENPDEPISAEELEESVAKLTAGCSPNLGGEPNDSAEILGRNKRVQTISYCNTEGNQEQIGPHFLAVAKPQTIGGVDYWHGQILDGRWGHYSMEDGSAVYGGPTEEISDLFEDIDGKPYKRVKEKDGRVALKDVRGGRYTGVAHDTIRRDPDTVLKDHGVVYHVTDDGKGGWYLNEKICGGNKNGMNHKTTIVKVEKEKVMFRVGDEMVPYRVFLIAENKKGFKKVVDIETGEILFGNEDSCTDVVLEVMGREICARKTYGSTQEVRDEGGNQIYYGFTAMLGAWFNGPGGPFQRTYDKKPINPEGTEEERQPGLLTIVDKASTAAKVRSRFGTETPANREGTGSPNDGGVFEIDRKQLLQLFVNSPDPSDEHLLVTFPDRHGKDPFRGPHYKLGKTKDDKPVMVTVEGLTGILFKNKSKAIYYIGSNGTEMFGGQHFDQLDIVENWRYDARGKRTESPETLIHFVELSGQHVVIDHKVREFFPKDRDTEKPEGHTKIEDFWVLSYNEGEEDRNVLIAEAKDPVGLGRSILSWIRRKGWTPSTYYLQDGTNFRSIDELKQELGAPKDAPLIYARGFKDPNAEDMKAKKDRARDTRRMDVAAAPGIDPKLAEMLRKAGEGNLDMKGAERIIGADSADVTEGVKVGDYTARGGEKPVEGAPEGVEVADAEIVLPEESEDASAEVQPVEEASGESTEGNGMTDLASMLLGEPDETGAADDGNSSEDNDE